MGTQPGAGTHPKELARRQRRKAKYPEPPIYTPDAFWTEFAREVSCCRIAEIDTRPYFGFHVMSVAIRRDGTIRWYTAQPSDLLYWSGLIKIYKQPHEHWGVAA